MAADGRVQIDVDLNGDKAIDGLNDIESSANRIGSNGSKQVQSFGSRLASIGKFAVVAATAVVGVGAAVGALAAPLVRAAGNAQALNAQFGQVFGNLEKEATGSLNAIAEQTGIIPERLKGAFTQIAAFAKTTGVDTAAALDLTTRATLAAADSAAFYDRSIEETTESLQSFLKGKVVAPL